MPMERRVLAVGGWKVKDIEVELKFPLKNPEKLSQQLDNIAKKEKEVYQKDTYFIPQHRNFLEANPVKEWLRVRETKKGSTINYKNWHYQEGKSVHCDEFETLIGKAETLKKIFGNLDFEEKIVVEKLRKNWNYKDTIIPIDKVEGLGNFIEIESNGNFKTVDEAKSHLYSVIKELGADIGEQVFKGYPFMLLEKKE